jgi:hypothetical protein
MLSSYLQAWLAGRATFWDSRACTDGGFSGVCDPSYVMTWRPGLVVLLGVTLALTAAAFAVFRRRDLN